MKRPPLLLCAPAAALLTSCAVSPLPPAEKQAAIKQVEGDWYYQSRDLLVDAMGQLDPGMYAARRLTIYPDGKIIFSVGNSAVQNRLTVMNTTAAGIDMRMVQAPSGGSSRNLHYDRATNSITFPVKMKSQNPLTGAWEVSYLPFSFVRAGAAR